MDWWLFYDWSLYVCLIVVLCTGWLINILGLPGLWVMLLAHIGYALATGWDVYTGLWATVALLALAIAAEIVEFVAGAAGSAKAGGTKRGMAGAIVGGLVGGLVGTAVIPVPVLGTIIGAVGGSFAGAALVERMIDSDNDRAIAIGIGAAKGRFWGILIKSGFGVIMLLVSLITAIPIWGKTTPAPTTAPTTAPATLPTTQALP